jgi:hypothetical protein
MTWGWSEGKRKRVFQTENTLDLRVARLAEVRNRFRSAKKGRVVLSS